jgi:hypothetical protein
LSLNYFFFFLDALCCFGDFEDAPDVLAVYRAYGFCGLVAPGLADAGLLFTEAALGLAAFLLARFLVPFSLDAISINSISTDKKL